MKKNITATLLFVLTATYCFAQDKQAILKVLYTQQAGWNKGDITAFMQGYWKSDSVIFMGKNGPNYGWQNTLDHYKKAYPDKSIMGQLTFSKVDIKQLDATNAFVIGAWHLKRAKGDVGGWFTLLFRKIKGEWKIVVDHTS